MAMCRLILAIGLVVAVPFRSAIAQAPGPAQTAPAPTAQQLRLPTTELSCQSGTQVLLLIQQANVKIHVVVEEASASGQASGKRLDARTVAPNEMPATLDLTPVVGGSDVLVSLRDRTAYVTHPEGFQSNLAGYIGCGQWQARIAGGELNAFLLKRTELSQSGGPATQSSQSGVSATQSVAPSVPTRRAENPVRQASDVVNGTFTYRGFTVDMSAVQNSEVFDALVNSIKHQIDITADCGAKPEVLSFFRNQKVVVQKNTHGHGGLFNPNNPGVSVEPNVQPPQKPILLHELLHAYHFRVLPGRFQNPDVLKFYNRAKQYKLYPENEYLMTNVKEYFAVTASLYLWGNVDREPHTRENLKSKQPVYYKWLGELFGVTK